MANAMPFTTEQSDFNMNVDDMPGSDDLDMDASSYNQPPVLHLHYACRHPYRSSRQEDIQLSTEYTMPADESSPIVLYLIKPRWCQPCLQQRISILISNMNTLKAKVQHEEKLVEIKRRNIAYLTGVTAGRINAIISPFDEGEVASERQASANFNNVLSEINSMNLSNDSSAVGKLAELLEAQRINNDEAWEAAMAKVECEMIDQGVMDGKKYQVDLEGAALAVVDPQQRAELLMQSLR